MKKFLYDEIAKRWYRGNGNAIYIYSDPHFSDEESYGFRGLLDIPTKEEYFASTPNEGVCEPYESVVSNALRRLDSEQVKGINKVVGKNDTIIFLGDIGNLDCIKRVRGYKVLIMGNHDKGATNYKKVVNYIMDNNNGKVEIDCNMYRAECNGLFDEVYEGPLMINDRVILSHEPIPPIPFMYNIHGHVHNKDYKGDDYHLNACAEAIGYTPINLIKILSTGGIKHIHSIHRDTVDEAVKRKKGKPKKHAKQKHEV